MANVLCHVRTAISCDNFLNTQLIRILLTKKQWISYSVASVPEITVPMPLKATIKKVMAKRRFKEEEQRKAISRLGDTSTPVITSKRKLLTHYKGQVYDKFKPLPLYTKGWFTRQSNGDYFQIQGHVKNPSLLDLDTCYDETPKDFKSLGFSPEIVSGLAQMNINVPTNVQISAIPTILKGQSVICAAETGCGKTLSYVAPLVQNILEYKSRASPDELFTNSPLGLILVPGRELAYQIKSVIKSITKDIPFSSQVIIGGTGTPQRLMYNPPLHFVDVIITTLGAFKKLVHTKIYNVEQVRHLIIDEVDTMLDDSFNDSLISFMKRFKFLQNISQNGKTQLCLVGATMPKDLATILNPVIKSELMEKITTDHLHRLMPHVPQKFLKLKPSDKPRKLSQQFLEIKLLETIRADLQKKKPTIIFSKDNKTCDYVTMFLKENGVDNINFNGGMPNKLRKGQFERFQTGEVDVLSCTDIGSRGLDTTRAQHVINYDFPSFVSDYIHRCGRVGRVGSAKNGRVTSFISKKYEVELVQKIETSVRMTQSLPNVNANITRKLSGNGMEL